MLTEKYAVDRMWNAGVSKAQKLALSCFRKAFALAHAACLQKPPGESSRAGQIAAQVDKKHSIGKKERVRSPQMRLLEV